MNTYIQGGFTGFNPRLVISNPFTGKHTAIPSNLQAGSMGYFCRKEWKLESSTKIPFRFRLGSLAHCNYLEGKPNAFPNY